MGVLPFTASAALVYLEGGFTSFSGPVSNGDPAITALVNEVVVCSGSCSEAIDSMVSLTFTPPRDTVSFRSVIGMGSGSEIPETPNLLSFTPAPAQDVVAGQEFLLGTFTYTNGSWFPYATLGFSLTSVSSDPTLAGHVFSDSLRLTVTRYQPTNTPQQNADFVSFVGRPDLGSARAYELGDSPTGSNILTWDLYGRINSLIPTRFASGVGGGFLDPSVELQPTVVPVPAAVWLFGSGLLGLFGIARREQFSGGE